MTRGFLRELSLLIHYILSFASGSLFLFSNPSLAWQFGGKASLSLISRRHQAQNDDKLARRPIAATTGLTTVCIVSPSVWAAQDNYKVVENMVATNNSVVAAAGISAIAVISSILSWRRMQTLQNELDALKQEKHAVKSNTKQKSKKNTGNQNKNSAAPSDRQDPKSEKHGNQDRKQSYKMVPSEEPKDLAVMRIGVIRSIYRLCVGTPRQGLLAPDARGRIELDKIGSSSTAESVSGLEEFSYIWVVFHFHLNTQSSKKERRFKSKIAPPALGGKKVGIYATRSPHRHNPIGITLCKLDRIQVHGPHEVTLHVSGLDLVDGTPVLDVKPYVPVYDSVNAFAEATSMSVPSIESETPAQSEPPQGSLTINNALQLPPPRVPEWVEGGLATKRSVSITDTARNELESVLQTNPKALEFYGRHCYRDSNTSDEATLETMLRVIEQVLSIDVRSSHQTRKARTGRSQAERAQRVRTTFDVESTNVINNGNETAEPTKEETSKESNMCTQQLDNLLIYFRVTAVDAKRDSSHGSGAEDGITVESIQLLSNTERSKQSRR